MAPTVVLIQLMPTQIAMKTTTNNKHSASIASNNASILCYFDVYQQTSGGFNKILIRALVPVAISIEPYRKVLIVKLFFRQILPLFNTLFVSFNNLMTAVASYFSINTESTEREVEASAASIRKAFFNVSNV